MKIQDNIRKLENIIIFQQGCSLSIKIFLTKFIILSVCFG